MLSTGSGDLQALQPWPHAVRRSRLSPPLPLSELRDEQTCRLPPVAIRHWICSLPWGLRALLGYDRRLCAEVVSAFVGELGRSLRRRAKAALGLGIVADAHTGVVAAVQRTDSALRLNVHFHVLALDGVYVRDKSSGRIDFHALPTPTRAEVADVAARTAERIEQILRAHGRSLDPEMQDDEPPELCLDEPGLAAGYAAAARGVSVSGERAGQAVLRLVVLPQPTAAATGNDGAEPVAEVRGINLHARQRVDGRDRRQLERLCRYITRPPVAQERLEERPDGRLELALESVWKDGTRAILLGPQDFVSVGRGCSGMCSRRTLIRASAAVDRCGGSRLRPPGRPQRGCLPSSALRRSRPPNRHGVTAHETPSVPKPNDHDYMAFKA
jgi:hypothetical protein